MSLKKLFSMQTKLNEKHGVYSQAACNAIASIANTMKVMKNNGKVPINKETYVTLMTMDEDNALNAVGTEINMFIACMQNELEELRDCTYWKHWCKEYKEGLPMSLHDIQNARVEVVDLWHFLITITQLVGLCPEDLMSLYEQKNDVNNKRAEGDYNMSNKTEDDNKNLSP